MLSASPPSTPLAPSTSWNPDTVTVSWTAPAANGASITSYTILIRTSDTGVYTTDLTNCNGASSSILAAAACQIPVSDLRAAPFSLPWGTEVYAKIVATNSVGDSNESPIGHGAIITTNPDDPTSLAEDATKRTATSLGLTWTQGASNGGAVVIDYRVSISSNSGSYQVLASGVTSTSYTATSLNSGTTYSFKIEARNSYGFSALSNTLSLYCGYIPATPTAPTTSVSGNMAVITWSAPAANGATITSYQIYIQVHGTTSYVLQSECDGTSATVLATTTCSI